MTTTATHTNRIFGLFSIIFLASIGAALYFDEYSLAVIPFGLLFTYAAWIKKELLFYLLLVSLPFSIEYQFNSSLGTDFPDEGLMLLTSLIFFGYAIYNRNSLPARLWTHPLFLLLMGITGWSMVTALFSTQPMLSFKYVLAKGWYIGAFVLAPLILFRSTEKIKNAGLLLAGSFLLVTMICMLRHALLGFSFAGINPSLSPFFRNHVNYSAMLVALLPVFLLIRQSIEPGKGRVILNAIIALLLFALFLSYARGAWLALVMGMITYWLIRKRMMVWACGLALLIGLSAILYLKQDDRYLDYAHDYQSTIFHQDFREHLLATYEGKDVSTAERFYRWIAGARMVNEYPLTGFGPNTFYPAYQSYTIPAFRTWVSNNPERSTVHNYFLLIWVEQGIPALILFLLFAFGMLYYAQKIYHRKGDIFYRRLAMMAGVSFSMILLVNCLSDLVETDKIGSLFFLCLSVLLTSDFALRDQELIINEEN